MSSSEEVGGGGDDDNGGGGGTGGGPSSSRRRRGGGNGVWPEPFLEALASQIAIDASRSIGRLAAAQALSSLFQVCTLLRRIHGLNFMSSVFEIFSIELIIFLKL